MLLLCLELPQDKVQCHSPRHASLPWCALQKHVVNNNNNNEMYDYTNNNWSHWNSNEKLKEKSGSCARKTLDRFTTKDSYTWNITHNTESTAV